MPYVNREDTKLLIDILNVEIEFNKSEGAGEYVEKLNELKDSLDGQLLILEKESLESNKILHEEKEDIDMGNGKFAIKTTKYYKK